MNPEDESEYGQMTPEQQENSDTTNAAAKAAAPKPPIVTKEELAKSGLSLRDYMNKQQGLTRRESPKSVTVEKTTVSKPTPEPSFEDRVAAIKEAKGYTSPSARIPQGSASGNKGPGGVSNIDSTELGRNVSNAMNALTPLGGGVAKIGAELAMAGRGAKTASKVAEVAEKGREAVTNPAAWTGGPKAMKTIQKVEDAANKVADKASKAARASKKRTSGNIPDKDTNGGAIGYKKGGSTGGRGDGIARKGHTKGRYL